jgi:hypothetical protein
MSPELAAVPRPRRILVAISAAVLLGSAAGMAARFRPDPLPLALTGSPAAVVTVTGGAAQKIQWGVTPKADQVAVGQSLYLSGPPGQYQVTAAVLSAGELSLLQQAVTIPPSQPAPGPPGPAPVTPVVVPVDPALLTWAIAVFDTSTQIALPPGQLALFKSQTVVAALNAVGVVYRHYDVGDPAVTGSAWGAAALKLQKPALVLWRKSGIVPGYPVNLPATEADLVELITKAVQP